MTGKIKYINGNLNGFLQSLSYYRELAEMGVLEDYLITQANTAYKDDPKFRSEMQEILLQYSTGTVGLIETLYLQEISDSLKIFLEAAEQCRIQKY